MNSAIDVGNTRFGTQTDGDFASGIFGKAYSLQTSSDKMISLMELENRLEMLGPKAKRGLMAHIQRSNPRIASEGGFVELGMLQQVLEGLFGKASDLLMQQICPPSEVASKQLHPMEPAEL